LPVFQGQGVAKSIEIKIPDDIEFRVMGNALGMLIVSAGLLGGEMVRQRSFDYWLEDIFPLLLLFGLGYRLFRNFLSTMIAYKDEISPQAELRNRQIREALKLEPAAMAQITAKTGLSPEKVMDEVARRIENKKLEALKKDKFIN